MIPNFTYRGSWQAGSVTPFRFLCVTRRSHLLQPVFTVYSFEMWLPIKIELDWTFLTLVMLGPTASSHASLIQYNATVFEIAFLLQFRNAHTTTWQNLSNCAWRSCSRSSIQYNCSWLIVLLPKYMHVNAHTTILRLNVDDVKHLCLKDLLIFHLKCAKGLLRCV